MSYLDIQWSGHAPPPRPPANTTVDITTPKGSPRNDSFPMLAVVYSPGEKSENFLHASYLNLFEKN